MPMLIPTPDELTHIPGHKRDKIHRAIIRILNDVDDLAGREIERLNDAREFGEQVRDEARLLYAALTPEPDHITRARQQALIQATR